jgi:hypothetical protein
MTTDTSNTIDTHEFLTDDRALDQAPYVYLSPSGRFRLEVRKYRTKPNCWMYSRGTVTRVADGAVVADLCRNYSAFHHSFVTKDGRDFLITGRSYMGQTIVDLEREQAWNDPRWPDGYEGHEFCWAAIKLSPDGRTLLVDGCHWACPYEYRFFDFTDPAQGWPALPIRDAKGDDVYLPAEDRRPPELRDDGAIVCYESNRRFLPRGRCEDEIGKDERATIEEAEWKDPANWETVIERRVTLVREPDHMRITEDWRSDDRLRRDREAAAADAAENAMHDEWIARCTALSQVRAALAAHYLESSLWITTPVGENAGKPGSFTLHVKTPRSGVTASVGFGVDEGSLTVSLGRSGSEGGYEHEKHELPRDEAGAQQAAAAIKRWLEG